MIFLLRIRKTSIMPPCLPCLTLIAKYEKNYCASISWKSKYQCSIRFFFILFKNFLDLWVRGTLGILLSAYFNDSSKYQKPRFWIMRYCVLILCIFPFLEIFTLVDQLLALGKKSFEPSYFEKRPLMKNINIHENFQYYKKAMGFHQLGRTGWWRCHLKYFRIVNVISFLTTKTST